MHQLARQALNQGGGATCASTNADSYAWLANSKFWWDLTGYFPRPPNYKETDNSVSLDQSLQEQTGWTLNPGTVSDTTSETEITTRLNAMSDDFTAPSSPSSTGKALSIAMVSYVNSHSGGASSDNEWRFCTTTIGHAIGSCGETDGYEIAPEGASKPKLASSADPQNLPWPAGEFTLNIKGEECNYKCDGTTPGRLFRPKKETSCYEDSMKSKAEGMLKCGDRQFFHAVVYCDL